MSPSLLFLFFFAFIFSSLLLPFHGGASLHLPIRKDGKTRQYTTTVYMKTPLQRTKLLLDLEASFSWMDCFNTYNSTSYQHYPCNPQRVCESLGLACYDCFDPHPGPGCANNSCTFSIHNPVSEDGYIGNALGDKLALPTTTDHGWTQGPLGSTAILRKYTFGCAPSYSLDVLPKGVVGRASLGWFNLSLRAQVSAALSEPGKSNYFALCLPSTRGGNGVAVIGSDGPYKFFPAGIDLSKSLIYTPLIRHPHWGPQNALVFGRPEEYFVGLASIVINGEAVPLDKASIDIDKETGRGGTKISSMIPYTRMRTSIYKNFTERFVKEASAMNLSLTEPVKPFSYCYSGKDVAMTSEGPAVPTIDLVFQSKEVYWRISGSNSMVRVARKGVEKWCLGFIDAGEWVDIPIVIGGHQLEDNLIQFDLQSRRLGFSSSLLSKGTTCTNFNFKIQ